MSVTDNSQTAAVITIGTHTPTTLVHHSRTLVAHSRTIVAHSQTLVAHMYVDEPL